MRKGSICEIDGVSYTVEEKLGQGGTAEVWRARSSADGRCYALKLIKKQGNSASRHERFRNEIRFGTEADHTHVVKVNAWREDDAAFLYVMELYSTSLRQVIVDEPDAEVLLDYLAQLCQALKYVHAEGIAHRDIKPENILVDTANRHLVLADFGIAHFKDSSLTRPNEVLANRNYQAPEQMVKKHPDGIGAPADVFALGLIMTELFTKQNARGARHTRIRHVHPFLSDLDDLAERMTLQDSTQRINIASACDSVELIRRQTHTELEAVMTTLRQASTPSGGYGQDSERVLRQAARDVASAKHIFERASDDDLAAYNRNYHCEVSFSVSAEMFNLCLHSRLYKDCKAKFENEMRAEWDESAIRALALPRKATQLEEFEEIQRHFPLPQDSLWSWSPLLAAHYFRFCKEYHCDELLASARTLTDDGPGSLRYNLVDSPILWIVSSVRQYLTQEGLGIEHDDLKLLPFEAHVRIHWPGTSLVDAPPEPHSAPLFNDRYEIDSVSTVLNALRRDWNVSVGEQANGKFSVVFSSRTEFDRFRDEALEMAATHEVFEADVLDLLRPVAEYDDLVAFMWEPLFTIRVTLAKIMGLREI